MSNDKQKSSQKVTNDEILAIIKEGETQIGEANLVKEMTSYFEEDFAVKLLRHKKE
jgi:hypothetical protein